MKKVLLFIFAISLLTGCQKETSIYDVEDGVIAPCIYINGSLYDVHSSKRNEKTLDDSFSYYGTVQSVVSHKFDLPKEELQGSKLLDNCIGYKVYISDDKDLVAIFIESLDEYAFFD